ncbi:MAG TPA: hypothetical protein VFW98_07835 [Gemmatimonadaceae bacterium]|nr:hypothetical protein [Gemmatimonadaceae bacterium]
MTVQLDGVWARSRPSRTPIATPLARRHHDAVARSITRENPAVLRFQIAMGCVLAVVLLPPCIHAQQIALPVLQNAFVNPGVTLGIDYGSGSDATTGGVAVAWVPSHAHVQLSGGAGVYDPDQLDHSASWGLRAMVPAPEFRARALGIAAFAGVGGTSRHGATRFRVPLGVSIGYRYAVDSTRGVSGFVAPFYSWSRASSSQGSRTKGLFRVSVGADAVIAPGLGLTVGYEAGSAASVGEPGPTGGIFGLGLSYAFTHPR